MPQRSDAPTAGRRTSGSLASEARAHLVLEETDHRAGEGVVLVAGHHVRCPADVDDPRVGDLAEELLHALLGDHVAQRAAHEQRGHAHVLHRRVEDRLEVLPRDLRSVPGVDVLLIGPSDLSIELGVPLDYACDTYQRGLDKIAAAAAKHGIAAGMYFIPPGTDPNFYVQKGFKFFTMPWGPWAQAGIQNALAGIKR